MGMGGLNARAQIGPRMPVGQGAAVILISRQECIRGPLGRTEKMKP